MTSPPHLRPEDRGDFEWVLHLALSVTDIRTALNDGRTATDANQLRERVLAAKDEIAAAAADEYRALLKARAGAAAPADRSPDEPPTSPGAGVWLPAVAVFAPLISAAVAVVLLLLGYGMHLSGTDAELADSLTAMGWISAVFAAGATAIGLAALMGTAIRQRAGEAPRTRIRIRSAEAQQAREAWQQALLERGVLPYLRDELSTRP
ncbi:hypothetical protein RCO28_27560 [Streptomyces sp. LHD-70]|uniref:hypothetical protein n=1 Tax=Streptomyces sp. LHD-70 TaxID=3072140 RepID=UPI00280FC422|nr:hypothetical protein [Streptomyces sp. LHD-70]MDQ8706198.1 hypothetical protein [Streptomyces sp. LHD-70]